MGIEVGEGFNRSRKPPRQSQGRERRRAKKKLYARLNNDSRVSRSVRPRSNAETTVISPCLRSDTHKNLGDGMRQAQGLTGLCGRRRTGREGVAGAAVRRVEGREDRRV